MENQFEFEQEKDIEEFFKSIKRANDAVIEKGKGVWPVALYLEENGEMGYFDLNGSPEILRIDFFSRLSKLKIKGYIVIMPGGAQGADLVFRTLYTPKNIIKNIVYLKDNKNIGERTIESREHVCQDFYDLWGDFNTIKGFKVKE